MRVTSSGTGNVSPFWPADPHSAASPPSPVLGEFGPVAPPAPVSAGTLRGLAVTDDHYLLVGVTGDWSGLLVFDLRTGGPPMKMSWPDAAHFEPFDMVARPGGGAFILDRSDGSRPARVWRLDRNLRVEGLRPVSNSTPTEEPTFVARDGGAAQGLAASAEGVESTDAAEVGGDAVAIDLAVDPTTGEQLVLLLNQRVGEAAPALRVLDADLDELPTSPHALEIPDGRLNAHDVAFVPAEDASDGTIGRVYVADAQGDQVYLFTLTSRAGPLAAEADFLPMRLFGGHALVADRTSVFYDSGERWQQLIAQRRPNYAESFTFESKPFDGAQPNCVWHRLMIDGCIPAETTVTVWAATDEDRAALEKKPNWIEQPQPYRRDNGPERPYVPWPADPRYGTYELLFQRASGRYLRLRLGLSGNKRATPRLRALRAYYPRFSYVERYLPGIYRLDSDLAGFLEAFLANFEGFYTTIEDRIAAIDLLFDPNTAPRETLDWLASWFAVVLDPGWDEERRRLLLRHVVELYRWRGTKRGLRIALGLALLACPDDRLFEADSALDDAGIRIIERFQTKRLGQIQAGDASDVGLPRISNTGPRWSVAEGGVALHQRWAAYAHQLSSAGSLADEDLPADFPILPPDGDLRPYWRAFADQVLGFVPSMTAGDAERWQRFLARRYLRIGDLNAAHRRLGEAAYAAFEDAPIPVTLPSDGAPLVDWYEFEAVVLRAVRAAHRFSVLLPVPTGRASRANVTRASDVGGLRADELRVERLVSLEKPSHTVFDVKSYWLAFIVGEARLGQDTLLDFGSRSTDLRPPAVLGSMEIGAAALQSEMADVPDRPAAYSGSVRRSPRGAA